MSRSLRSSLALVGLLGLMAAPATASPPDIYGFGARGISMAGAMTAAVDDTSANFYNPAALTRSNLLQLDTGYLVTHTALTMNGQDVGVDESNGFQMGVIVPGEIGPVRLAFGLGLFLPESRISRVRALPQHQPRFVFYDNRPQRVFINTNIAVRPLPWLHIGAGIAFLTETRGRLDLDGVLFLDQDKTDRSFLRATVDVDFTTIRYPFAGLLFTPDPSWSIGLTYREEVKAELDLEAAVDGAIGFAGLQIAGAFALQSLNSALFTPRQLWLGATWKPVDELLLSLDVGWLNWSAFPSPTAAVKVELDVPDLPIISSDQLPQPTPVEPTNFKDIVSVRFGLEGTVRASSMVQIDFRTGYAFEPSPAPDQPGLTSYVDNHKHTVGYGLGITLHDWNPWVSAPVSIDVAGQVIVMQPRTYLKDDPTNVIGDFEAGGLLATFSGTVRWRF